MLHALIYFHQRFENFVHYQGETNYSKIYIRKLQTENLQDLLNKESENMKR